MRTLGYEYDEDSNATHQRTHHVDEHPSDTYPEKI